MVAAHEGTQTTALDFVQKTLHLGATVLQTQDDWTSTPETRSQACLLCNLPAQDLASHFYQLHAPQFASTSLRSAFSSTSLKTASVPCTSRLCPELSTACNRLCPLLLSVCPQFCLGMHTGFGLRVTSDEESPYAEDIMGRAANLQLEPGRSSREPPWTTSAGPRSAVAASAPRARAKVPRAPRALGCSVCPFLAKTGGSRLAFFCHDYFSSTSSYRQSICVPVQVFIFGTTFCVENIWHLLLPLVAQDPIPRAHRLFSPHQSAAA